MLVLTRKPGEEILIGDNIRLTVVRIDGGKVRLGIAAPASVPVRRQEICALQPSERVPFSATAMSRDATLVSEIV
jgi:carbon storage regulator